MSRSPYRQVASTCPAAEVRSWALRQGLAVSSTGGLPRYVYDLYVAAHASTGTQERVPGDPDVVDPAPPSGASHGPEDC